MRLPKAPRLAAVRLIPRVGCCGGPGCHGDRGIEDQCRDQNQGYFGTLKDIFRRVFGIQPRAQVSTEPVCVEGSRMSLLEDVLSD